MSVSRRLCATAIAAGCGAGTRVEPAPAVVPWSVPAGWRSELIPFPLDFAPSLSHRGVEEIRFAPGFFDPAAPGFWSYAFVWRLASPEPFAADRVAGELTTYFRGLVDAVDDKHEIADRTGIAVEATGTGAQLALVAHVIDPFATKRAVELAGTARALTCVRDVVWVFTFAPVGSALRGEVDAVAGRAACDQPPVPNRKKS